MSDIDRSEFTEEHTAGLITHFAKRKKLFVTRTSLTFINTNYRNKIFFRNSSGSGVNCIILGIEIAPDLAATTSQLNQVSVRLHQGVTASDNGSGMLERNLWLGEATPNGIATYDPTISDTGNLISEQSNINSPIKMHPFILSSDDNFLLRIKVNDSNNGAIVNIIWAEDDE